MPFIHLTTFIAAPPEKVFDLGRSVDLHRVSMKEYDEKITDGRMSGLLESGDTITWTARHLFRQRILKTKVTQLKRPEFFVDEQVQGDFVMMKHEHYFKAVENGTLMIDQFHYEAPYGKFGAVINRVFLEKYMTRLLEKRNTFLKAVAEGNQWKQYIIE